ncbi:MAG TPA: hypothetical protein VI873_04080 [Candidatus Peribacteraceae bacterium]|nr:hypothetical protein [Candidatus Peribacteraceae bacterium]
MNKRITQTGSIFLFLTLIPFSSAAVAQTVEPVTGFTRGADPEWSSPHMEFHGSEADHRAYHAAQQRTYREWLDLWTALKGTDQYENAHRDFRAGMNAEHREWHRTNGVVDHEDMDVILPPAGHGGIVQNVRDRKSRRMIEGEQHEQWMIDSAGF